MSPDFTSGRYRVDFKVVSNLTPRGNAAEDENREFVINLSLPS